MSKLTALSGVTALFNVKFLTSFLISKCHVQCGLRLSSTVSSQSCLLSTTMCISIFLVTVGHSVRMTFDCLAFCLFSF